MLRAAARTINRLGYHVATLDDVADELGVTKPALYYYAKSKDELLFACGQLALQELSVALDKSIEPGLSGLERLCRFFQLYAAVICEDFGRCLVFTQPRDLVTKSRKENYIWTSRPQSRREGDDRRRHQGRLDPTVRRARLVDRHV